MALVDRTGAAVRANAALEALAGPVAVGVPIDAIFGLACRGRVRDALGRALAGEEALQFTAVVPGPGGDRTVQARPVPLPASRPGVDRPTGLLLHVQDLTAQAELEARLAHGERLRALGELAGGVAHDFNNLLAAVLGAADEALARPGLDAPVREDLRQVRDGARRGAALAARLLALGAPPDASPGVVEVNDAVRDVSGLLRRLLGHGIELAVELEQPGGRVRVDPAALDHLLLNLAANARDAMPGGGRLTLRTGHLTLRRPRGGGAERGRYATIEVADTGAGIPPEVLPRIFAPYFTTKRDHGGTGLGLAAVQDAAREAGGFVTVSSALGQGASVRVHLPLHEGAPAPAPPGLPSQDGDQPAVQAPPRPTRRVLLVDDEGAVLRLAERALARRGWLVLAAGSAEEALDRVAALGGAGRLALVVADLSLPGMDGAALIRRLRAERPGLPAILASGLADAALRDAAEVEKVDILAKPYTPRALAARIGAMLDHAPTSGSPP